MGFSSPQVQPQTQSIYPQLQQQQQQQQYLHADSGISEHNNENTMYGMQHFGQHGPGPITDMSLINNNRISIYQQPQQGGRSQFPPLSLLNSPQQMSTPINMRTKDIFGFQQQSQSQFSSSQPQRQSNPNLNVNNPFQTSQQQNQLPKFQPTQQQQNPVQSQFLKPQQPTTTTTTTGLQYQQQSECEIFFSGKHDALYIYLSRLLAPIWDQSLLIELSANPSEMNDSAFLFATFNEINIQWYLNKLNEMRKFIELNFPHLKQVQQQQS